MFSIAPNSAPGSSATMSPVSPMTLLAAGIPKRLGV